MVNFKSYLAVAAMTPLALAGCGKKEAAPAAANPIETQAAAPVAAPDDISEAELRAHIATLASDEFEGRAPGTPGGEKTRAYIAGEFERIGLEPIGESFFQATPLTELTLDPQASFFRIGSADGEAKSLQYKSEIVYWSKRAAAEVAFENSELVFVGYGVVAPEYGWDDYKGVDVRGKTVVMLVNDPGFATQDPELFNGNAMTYYGRWTYKFEEAARQGAAAALIIHDTAPAAYGWGVVEGSWSGPQIDLERADAGASRAAGEGWIQLDVARDLFARAGLDLDAQMTGAKSRDFTAVAMGDLTADMKIVQAVRKSDDANVVGVLRGSEAPDEYVVYMGHWDHLGKEETDEPGDHIFNGAVDNATGVAAILEIAEKFATRAERPRRSIIFAGVTAEESGLLGSAFMAEYPPVPLKQIVGGINIDAILPTPPTRDIIVVGFGASELEDILAAEAAKLGKRLRPDAEPEKGYYYRSDHISFAKKGVPMLYADSGVDFVEGGEEAGKAFGADYGANRYHKPQDEYSDDWRMDGMLELTGIFYNVGATMADGETWPNWYEGAEFRALRDRMRSE